MSQVVSNVTIIGSPFHYGQSKYGTELSPAGMRSNGLIYKIEELGYKVNDLGDYYPYPVKRSLVVVDGKSKQLHNPHITGVYNKMFAKLIQEEMTDDTIMINLGGDHSTSIGSINGILSHNPDTVVIWIDAHADINVIDTSPSGNIHGMPIAFLTGLEDITILDPKKSDILCPKLKFNQFGYIGLRSVDDGEKMIIKDNNIIHYDMKYIRTNGIKRTMSKLFHELGIYHSCKRIHVSFDIDSVDPQIAPSTGTPSPNGLTKDEIMNIFKIIGETGKLISMDIAEINPLVSDSDGYIETVQLANECILTALYETKLKLK